MKFIFPKNYSFNSKLLGFIDYQTAIFNIVLCILFFIISSLLHLDLLFKIILFIFTCFPIFLISLFCFRQENIVYVFKYLYIFLKSNKLYLYSKTN